MNPYSKKEKSPNLPTVVKNYIKWFINNESDNINKALSNHNINRYIMLNPSSDNKYLKDYINNNKKVIKNTYTINNNSKNENIKYFEIVEESDWSSDLTAIVPDDIIFLEQELNPYNSFIALQKLYRNEHGKHLSMGEMLEKTIINQTERADLTNRFIQLYPELSKNIKSFKDIIKAQEFELFKLAIPKRIDKMFYNNGFDIYKVGHDNWTYFASHKDRNNFNKVIDIWEGTNYYTIKSIDTDINNKFIGYKDKVQFVYAPIKENLIATIEANYNIERKNIYLIENKITKNIKNVKKVKATESIHIHEL